MQFDAEFLRRTRDLRTPAMIVSTEQVKKAYSSLREAFPGWPVHYAVKANPHPALVDTLRREGAGFEVASRAETESLLEAGVPPSRILCLHPIKAPEYLTYLAEKRIEVVAADCADEIEKIARHAPGSKVVLRLRVDKKGSSAGHHGKFGMEPGEASRILRTLEKCRLAPWGITFHPGSQCADLVTWRQALDALAVFWNRAQLDGVGLRTLIVGGGLPVSYRQRAVPLKAVAKTIKDKLATLRSPPENVMLEPGRILSAQAAILMTSVIGVAKRRERSWLFLDAGVFNGVPETLEFSDRRFFRIATEPTKGKARKKKFFVAGPSCHGLDTPFEGVMLPDTGLGERLYILDVGAYNSTTWSRFNGFEYPDLHVYESLTRAKLGKRLRSAVR